MAPREIAPLYRSTTITMHLTTFLLVALTSTPFIAAVPAPRIDRDLAPIGNLAARDVCPAGESYGCRLTFTDAERDATRHEQEAMKATGQECGCFPDA